MKVYNLEYFIKIGVELLIKYGIRLALAILLLIVGFWLSKRLTKTLQHLLDKKNVDISLHTFLSSLINVLIKAATIALALCIMGLQLSSIATILAAASLAIGMALSGTLQNFAGGVVLLVLKPFKVGDFIETSSSINGTVQDIQIFTTSLKTPDGKICFLPNGALSNGVITNYTRTGSRRLDLTVNIAYGDDVTLARKIINDIIANDSRIYTTPEPLVFLNDLSASWIVILIRVWTDSGNVFPVKFDLNEKMYNRFPAEGIHFPFPQISLHVENDSKLEVRNQELMNTSPKVQTN